MSAESRIKRWRESPVAFVQEAFGVTPDGWQAEFLRNFPTNQRLAVKSGKGPGKTCLLAWCCWNFLATRPDPKIIATSITGDNLFDNLWPEMNKWMERSPFLKSAFEWNKTRIFARQHPETWFMSGRTWARGGDTQQQANTLAGTHADYVMYVLDEAGGIPDAVAATAEGGLASGKETKIIMAGNPTNLEGPLYRACTSQRDMWHLTEITSDPDDPNRTSRVSKEWAQQQIDAYGRDNPWVLVNVFGKFPPSSMNALLGPEEVEAAMKKVARMEDFSYAQKRMGVDVAREGDDRTVLFPRQGLCAFVPVEMRNATGPQVAARAALARDKWDWETCFVDDTGGFGGSVIDSMNMAYLPNVPINFSGKADDPRYLNKRAEMWFRMAEWVKRGGILPNNPQLVKELTTPTYWFQNGKMQLEPKEQIKKRLGFSPDLADALALTFAFAEAPKNVRGMIPGLPQREIDGIGLSQDEMPSMAGRVSIKSEFDPFREARETSNV